MKYIQMLKSYKNKTVVFFFIMSLFFSQFMIQYQEVLWPKLYMLIVIIAMIGLLIFSSLNNEKKIAWNAFVCIVILGGANALIMPVRYNLDENTHYYHVLQIADGKFRNQSDEKNFLMISPDFLAITKLPSKQEYKSPNNANLYDKEFRNLKNISSSYKKEWTNDTTKRINNPAYYPSALGVFIGRKISNRLMVSYYLGRMFNVIFYAILVLIGISISKKYRLQLFVASTIPYTLWISAGYSYDSLYYGLSIIAGSLLFNLIIKKENQIRFKDVFIYSIVCSLFVLCKAPIALMIIVPLFISSNYYISKKDKIFSWFSILFGCVISLLWLIQGIIINIINSEIIKNDISSVNTNPNSSRLSYFIDNPFYTMGLFARSFSDVFSTIYESVSKPWPFIYPSQVVMIVNFLFFFIIIVLVSHSVSINISNLYRYLILGIFFLITLGIFYAISGDIRVYSIGDLHIGGVQGRYHFYLMPLLPFLLSQSIKKLNIFKEIDQKKLSILVMKTAFIILFLNTCIGMYAYL